MYLNFFFYVNTMRPGNNNIVYVYILCKIARRRQQNTYHYIILYERQYSPCGKRLKNGT